MCDAGTESGAQTVCPVEVLSRDDEQALPPSSVRLTNAADVMLGQQVSTHRYVYCSVCKSIISKVVVILLFCLLSSKMLL